jgi:hypothetical protein
LRIYFTLVKGMLAHLVPLPLGERTRLPEDAQRDLHLAQVVEESTQADLFEGRSRQTDAVSQAKGENRHIHRMVVGVIIVILDRAEDEKKRLVLEQAVDHILDDTLRRPNTGVPLETDFLRHLLHRGKGLNVGGSGLVPLFRIAKRGRLIRARKHTYPREMRSFDGLGQPDSRLLLLATANEKPDEGKHIFCRDLGDGRTERKSTYSPSLKEIEHIADELTGALPLVKLLAANVESPLRDHDR